MRINKFIRLTLSLWVLFAILPDSLLYGQDKVTWSTLSQITFAIEPDGQWGATYSEAIKQLDGEAVKVTGFMLPISSDIKQEHFILSAVPLEGCNFCAPGEATQFVDVVTPGGKGISYTYDPITITGTLEMLPDAPMGVFLGIKEAKQVD